MARDIHGGPGEAPRPATATTFPTRYLPPVTYKDMPEPCPAQGPRPRGDRGRDRAGLGRVHPLALHHLPGRARLPVGGGRRGGDPVLHQHGDRALHPGHRRDRPDRVQPLLAALGPVLRRADLPGQRLAGVDHQLGHAGHLHLRRRQREAAGHPRAGLDRHRPDHGPGGLHHGRAGRVLQGRDHPVLPRGRHRHRDHRRPGRRCRTRSPGSAACPRACRWPWSCRRWPSPGPGRPEPGPEQLDAGQGLRHGRPRPPPGLAGHRRARGRARHRLHLPRGRGTWPAGRAGGTWPTRSSWSASWPSPSSPSC